MSKRDMLIAALVVLLALAVLALYGRRLQRREALERRQAAPEDAPEEGGDVEGPAGEAA